MIYTFGDSHSMFGWRSVDGVKFNWLGPKLMYSFGNNPEIVHVSSIEKEEDIIVFCFGEIDARCHVHKHINEDRTFQNIIDDLVDNYFKSIKKITKDKKNKIWIYNVVPPRRFNGGPNNPDFPYLGTDEERSNYTCYFNEKIREKCEEYNYIFFDVYEKYCDNQGFLNPDFADTEAGGGHINNPVYLIELKDKILENIKNELNTHQFID